MAEKNDAKSEAKSDAKAGRTDGRNGADDARQLTRTEAAARCGLKVRVPRIERGRPVLIAEGPLKGMFETIERAATAEDIFAINERAGRITVITVDGQRAELA
jgi:hypothetical protein